MEAWLDQTGNGNNAVTYAVPAGNRPTFGTDPVNNAPAVMYTLENKNYMMVNNSPSIALAGDMTIFMVANIGPDYTGYRQILGKNTGGYAAPYEINLATGNGRLRFSRGDGVAPGSGTAQSGSAAPTLNAPNVISTIGGPGLAVNTYLNGNTLAYSGNFSVPFADNGTPLYLGTRNSFDLFMGGDMQEVMLFSNALSASDRFNVDNYLGAKYFTFASTGPTNTTVRAGLQATFSVTASQGSAHFAYQWMENGTNILGATNASYTTPPVTVGDNGDSFSVAVSIPGTTAPTNVLGPVYLTVVAVPPVLLTVGEPVWITNHNALVVVFQVPVNPATALNLANYSLDNGATVLSAVMRTPSQVYLTTSPLVPGTAYTLTVRNVTDNFGSPMTPTTLAVTPYPSAPALWLQAHAGVSATPDGAVYSWADQSANATTFYNTAGGSYCPLLVDNAINGWPMLLFNATNQTYLGTLDSAPSLGLTGDMAIFAVMKFTTFQNPNGTDGPTGGGSIISKTDPMVLGAPAPYDYYVYYNSPYVPYFMRGNGTSSGAFVGGQRSPTAGLPHVLDVVMQGNTITHRLDAAPNGTIAWNGTTITDNGAPVYLGYRADGNVRLTGGMAELLMFGTTVASNDVVCIENYLGAKYGLLRSPPMNIAFTNNAGTPSLLISWPAPWPFVLQATPSLQSPVWSTVASPGTSAGPATVTIPATNSTQFYRLLYPTPL